MNRKIAIELEYQINTIYKSLFGQHINPLT
jgi:hypothetical protein